MDVVRITRTVVTLTSLCCMCAQAQEWSIPAATALPERTATGVNKTTPFFDPLRGSGVRLAPGIQGSAVVYLPVTVPNKTVFRGMTMRVAGVASGFVKADLYEQSSSGPPVRIGHLAAIDKNTSGAFTVLGRVLDRPINNAKNTYFVRVQMCKDSPLTGTVSPALNTQYPALYEVTLLPWCDCPPPPPWTPAERACKQ